MANTNAWTDVDAALFPGSDAGASLKPRLANRWNAELRFSSPAVMPGPH